MADIKPYKLSMSGAEANAGIETGMEVGKTAGILYGDANGGVRTATPGADYGYPLLEGNGPPSANTAANIGQHYFDMQARQAPYEYICVGFNSGGFVWIVLGDTGNGFIISGYFGSLKALNEAIKEGKVEAPTAGVSYGIGVSAPYDIYTWDGVSNDWVNNGPLGGSGGGSGVPPHGSEGQVLVKYSDADYDAGWGQVGTLGIAPGAVTTPKIADNAVTAEKLAPGAVGVQQLADNAIPDALGYNPGMVNPNLLDNWYFVGGGSQQGGGKFPINQRGQTSLSTADESPYWIDRWLCGWNTTVSIENGNVSVRGEIFQYVNGDLSGKEITISALCADNSLITTTGVFTDYLAHGGGAIKLALNYGVNPSFPAFIIDSRYTDSKNFVAVKLEFGSKQTLARQVNGQWVLNEIPDYREQLARCRWFYRRYTFESIVSYLGHITGTTNCAMHINANMRSAPVVQKSNDFALTLRLGTGGYSSVAGLNGGVPTSILAVLKEEEIVSIYFGFASAPGTNNMPVTVNIAKGVLELIADL